MRKLQQYLDDFIGIFFPNLCLACMDEHPMQGDILCVECFYNLPQTGFHEIRENEMFHKLAGKVWFENATALYYFQKEGPSQKLIHNLKQNNIMINRKVLADFAMNKPEVFAKIVKQVTK